MIPYCTLCSRLLVRNFLTARWMIVLARWRLDNQIRIVFCSLMSFSLSSRYRFRCILLLTHFWQSKVSGKFRKIMIHVFQRQMTWAPKSAASASSQIPEYKLRRSSASWLIPGPSALWRPAGSLWRKDDGMLQLKSISPSVTGPPLSSMGAGKPCFIHVHYYKALSCILI